MTTADIGTKRTQYASCTVDGCIRRARTKNGRLCETHYYRLRRTGKLTVDNPQRASRGVCAIDLCPNLDCGPHQLCHKHFTRVRRHGDPNVVKTPSLRYGDQHHFWKGDAAGYQAAHYRVTSERGAAAAWTCIDCGSIAQHWSYNHDDPMAKYDPERGPYSMDTNSYSPRCVSCHKRFDVAHLDLARPDWRQNVGAAASLNPS